MEQHETQVVRRPFDQVRPICTCGWQGTTCRNVTDARVEALTHESTARVPAWTPPKVRA